MDHDFLIDILNKVARGSLPVDEAAQTLKHIDYEDITYAHIDHHRSLRKGFPEVIFGMGKTAAQITGILRRMQPQEKTVLVTRVDEEKAKTIIDRIHDATYHANAGLLICGPGEVPIVGRGTILVLCAGTSDIPVAQEALLTAQHMGNQAHLIADVGVAGIHRLFKHRKQIEAASVLIVVAGMEGALPSVVAGMVSRPVIAVPTSVGYGVSFGGLTALFAMLNSCSSNVAVVNIDNGFGAGYMAAVMNRA
jgi:NCAIR mutase (PurE)-related protein